MKSSETLCQLIDRLNGYKKETTVSKEYSIHGRLHYREYMMANWTNEDSATPSSPSTIEAVTVDLPDHVPRTSDDRKREQIEQKRQDDDQEATDKVRQQAESTVIQNLIVVIVSFFLNVTAFAGISNLQSSMHSEGNVGHMSLTLVFTSPVVSNLLISTHVIRKLGIKWSMSICMFLTAAFPAANFHSSAIVQYVGACVTGLAGGVLWSAQGSYFTTLGRTYAGLRGQTPQSIIGRFFGLFFLGHRLAMTAGSLLSSLIFQKPDLVDHLPPDVVSRICGSAYCYEDLRDAAHWFNGSAPDFHETMMTNDTTTMADDVTSSIYRPSLLQMYSLYGIYIACVLLSPVIICIFMKPLETEVESVHDRKQEQHRKVNIWSNLFAALKHLTDVKMLLLMPITFLHGTSFAFITSDYGVGFTSCTLGIDSVGYVMALFGLTSGLTALCSGLLLKYTGRQALFFFGAACCLTTLAGMYKWIPNVDQPEILYLFAGLWGVCTTIWTSQLISFISLIFDNESAAPMACYYTMLNTAIGSWFFIGRNLCIYSQLHLLMLLLVVGMVGYSIVEVLLRKERARNFDVEDTTTTDADDVIRY